MGICHIIIYFWILFFLFLEKTSSGLSFVCYSKKIEIPLNVHFAEYIPKWPCSAQTRTHTLSLYDIEYIDNKSSLSSLTVFFFVQSVSSASRLKNEHFAKSIKQCKCKRGMRIGPVEVFLVVVCESSGRFMIQLKKYNCLVE